MKNSFTLAGIILLTLASLCFGQSNVNKTSQAKGKAMSQPSLDKALIEREKAVWETLKNKQFDAFRAFYADNFRSLSSDGVHDLNQEVEGARNVDLKDYSLTDMKVVIPNKETAIVTFKVTIQGSYKGEDISGAYYASSVWINQSGKWLAVFYTEAKAQ